MEPGQRAAPGHGQARPRRPRLHADHVRRLRLAAAVPADGRARHPDRAGAAQPRQRLGVRAADRRRQERLRADPRHARRRARPGRRRRPVRRPGGPGRRGAAHRGVRRRPARASSAPPTCATSARPTRCGSPCPTAGSTPALAEEVARRFHAEHRALYGYDFAADPSQQVEWVNLRVSGIGPIRRPEIRRSRPAGLEAALHAATPSTTVEPSRRPVCFEPADGYVETPVYWREDLGPGRDRDRPGDHRGVRLDRAAPPRLHRPGRRLPQPDRHPRSEA